MRDRINRASVRSCTRRVRTMHRSDQERVGFGYSNRRKGRIDVALVLAVIASIFAR